MRTLLFFLLHTLVMACSAHEVPSASVSALKAPTSIQALHSAYQENKYTVHALASHYMKVINDNDATYRAIIAINPEALKIAKELDQLPQDARKKLPLFGVPILLKDNIQFKGLPTTAGSLALKDSVSERDAEIVERLKSAGAVILGKTNLSEWANFRSERSSSGWSSVGGQSKNAVDVSRSPCGSSAGSAVAIALNYALVAIGTETNGSIVCPSSVNGIVGFKPSHGRVASAGIVPISQEHDVAGPMTTNVADALATFSVLAEPIESGAQTDLNKNKVWRIGILRSATGWHDGVDKHFDEVLAQLGKKSFVLKDDLKWEAYPNFFSDFYDVLLYRFYHDINAHLSSLTKSPVKSLRQLIAYNKKHAAKIMPYFGQEIFLKAQAMETVSKENYQQKLIATRKAAREDGLDKLLRQHKLDAIIAPTVSAAWSIDLINGDHYLGGFSTLPAVAGYPHLTLPMGKLFHLPLGLSITAGKQQDETVLALGLALEKALANINKNP